MKLNRFQKRAIIVGASIIAAAILIWLLFRATPVTVETASVTRGPLAVTVDGEGKTSLRNKIVVTAPISGRMSPIRLREGDVISRDFVIAGIDPNPPEMRPYHETEGQPNYHEQKVYAPIDGRVLRVIEKDARMIAAGAPLLEIGNPSSIEIVVDVLSTEASQVRPGAIMLIDTEGAAEPIRARVRTVGPQAFTKVSALGVEEQRVNIIADLPPGVSGLGDGYRVNVRIIIWQSDRVLKVPSSALFRTGDDWSVYVAELGRARSRKIKIDHQTPGASEVLEGLNENEVVVLHPPNQLSDGTSIKIR